MHVSLGMRLELAFDLPNVQCSIPLSHAKNEGGRHGILPLSVASQLAPA